MICLIGDRYGAAPSKTQSAPYASISTGEHSYTQWEYILAKHHGKTVYVFYPDEAPRDEPLDESDELRRLQSDFKHAWIEDPGIDHTPFRDQRHLKEEVLVIPSLTPESENLRVADRVNPANPYIGLRRFEKDDRAKFFGRDKLKSEVRAKIEASALTNVFGNSGSGKSSVLRAGVIPDWEDDHPDGKAIIFRLREVLVNEYENKKATRRRTLAVYVKELSCPEEPCAGKSHAGICEGGTEQSVSLPRFHPWFQTLLSQQHPLALQFWVPEIDYQSETATGNFEVVHHLPFLAVTNGITGFRINDDLFENYDIGYKFTNKTTLV